MSCIVALSLCAVRPVLPETVNAANCPPLCPQSLSSPRTSFSPSWSLSHLRFTCIIASKQANKQPDLLAHAGPWIHRWLADCSLQLATARRMIMHEGAQLTGKERHRPRLPETQRGKHQTSKGKKTLSRKPTLLDTANPGGPSSRPIETNKQMMSRRLPALSAPTLKHPPVAYGRLHH